MTTHTQTTRPADMSDSELEQYAERITGDDYNPTITAVDDTRDLRAVADAADEIQRLEAKVTEAVAIARAHGRSWTRIGIALGVSRQAARQRFAPLTPVGDVLDVPAGPRKAPRPAKRAAPRVGHTTDRILGGTDHDLAPNAD